MRFVFLVLGAVFLLISGIFRHISTEKYEFARRMGRRRQRWGEILYFFEAGANIVDLQKAENGGFSRSA